MKILKFLFCFLLLTFYIQHSASAQAWTKKADFGGGERYGAVGFSIGNKIYVGLGFDGSYYKDFWEYDPANNTWTQKADFGGTARQDAVGFSIGNKGYIGTGYDGSYKKDFWEYDPATDAWIQKAYFGGTGRDYAIGFSNGNKGYIGTGLYYDGTTPHFYKDFWEYNPDNDTTGFFEPDLKNNKIFIFPNPNNGVFKIQYSLSESTCFSVEILNIYSQLVKSHLFNNLSGNHEIIINAEDLGTGVYLVKLSSTNFNKVLKIVINK